MREFVRNESQPHLPIRVTRVAPFPHQLLRQVLRHMLAMVAVLSVGLVFGPEQAQASCGDYVMVSGHANPDGTMQAHSPGSQSSRGIPTCHGPGCQKQQNVPVSPPTRITLDEHSWGWIPSIVGVKPEASAFSTPSTHSVHDLYVGTGIFRPPRAIAGV